MKWSAAVRAILLTMGLGACGGDPPEAAPDEAAPEPRGVYGQAPEASQGIPSIIVLEPLAGEAGPPPSEPAMMDQLGLAFLPRQLVVRLGQPIEFANSETLAHNVHVRLEANDSSIYYADMNPEERSRITLDQEGAYDVICDEHPGMTAFIYVTSSPYAAIAEIDGSFVIPDVPPGAYRVRVWNATPELRGESRVDVSGTSTELDLSTTS